MKLLNLMSIALLAGWPLLGSATDGNGHQHADHTRAHNHDHANADEQQESWHNRSTRTDIGPLGEQLYTCSMHPQVRSPNPDDRCPICGMELIPVPQDDHELEVGDVPTLTLGPRALALTGVRTQPVQMGRAEITLRLPGRIEVNDRGRHTVSARFSGRIERLYVNTVGEVVRRGDLLADIYSPELMAAQEELLQAKRLQNQGMRADQGYTAARDKLRLLGVAPELLDAIEEEGQVREVVPIVAKGQGLVQSLSLVEGQYVQTGDTLYQLVDLTSVWAILEAYERDLSLLQIDQAVTLINASQPDTTLDGRIDFIEPWVDPVKRTAGVRVVLENPDQYLKPGTLVRAQVHGEQPPALLIPASAPLLTGARALVYVRDPERPGRFTAREVTLGNRAGDYYPVASGLGEGELVVTHGALRIDSELQIRGRPSMMAPTGGGAPAHDHGNGHGEVHGHEGHDTPDEGRADRQEHDHSQHQHDHQHPDPSPAPVTADEPSEPVDPELARALVPVFQAYDLAQQALADDRLDDWRQATSDLQTQAEAVTWPEALDPVRAQLSTGQGALDEVADLSAAGEFFYHHAQGMLQLAERGLAPGTWHVGFCPMASVAEQDGAHWLQRSSTLSNPYFGHAMLRCGDIQEPVEGHLYE